MSPPSHAEGKCPICRRPAPRSGTAFAPFCSPRCKDRDLLNWLGDGYAVPGDSIDPMDIALDKHDEHD